MPRLKVLALATALISATTAAAEPGGLPKASAQNPSIHFSTNEILPVERRGFTFPVVEYTDERGARQQRKGIIASKTIAPDTLIGIGLFETTPKSRGNWGDSPPNLAPRRSRRAASIGLNWRF